MCLIEGVAYETAHRASQRVANALSRAGALLLLEDGSPAASTELFFPLSRDALPIASDAIVPVRGVSDRALAFHGSCRIVEGRWFMPGRGEAVVGKSLSERHAGMRLGGTLRGRRSTWRVVGVMECGGRAFEDEIWTDMEAALIEAEGEARSAAVLTIRLPSPVPRLPPGADVPSYDRLFDRQVSMRRVAEAEDLLATLGSVEGVVAAVPEVDFYRAHDRRLAEAFHASRAAADRRRAVVPLLLFASAALSGFMAGTRGPGIPKRLGSATRALTSYMGRIPRLEFAGSLGLASGLSGLIALVAWIGTDRSLAASIALLLVPAWWSTALITKRIRDLAMNPAWIVLVLVPVVNLGFLAVLCLRSSAVPASPAPAAPSEMPSREHGTATSVTTESAP